MAFGGAVLEVFVLVVVLCWCSGGGTRCCGGALLRLVRLCCCHASRVRHFSYIRVRVCVICTLGFSLQSVCS